MRATQSSTSAYGKYSFTGSSSETPTVPSADSFTPQLRGQASDGLPQRLTRSPLAHVLPAYPAEIIASCAGLLHQAAGRPVTIRPVPDHLPGIAVCAEVLERILLNLVRNAGTATGSSGSITVSAASFASAAFVAITVEDTGRGMSETQLARLKASPGRRGAKGIGLFVVRMLAAGSGGAVRIISREEAGTRVEVFLPTLEQDNHALEDDVLREASDPLAGGTMLWLHRGPAGPQPAVQTWIERKALNGHQHNGRARGGKTVTYVV